MQPVQISDALVQSLQLQGNMGVMVLGVEPGGPADQAGILMGDVVVALNGARVADTSDVQTHLGGDRIGTTLTASVIRAGSLIDVNITVGESPHRRHR
jgi:S1-C subfamily serine protease